MAKTATKAAPKAAEAASNEAKAYEVMLLLNPDLRESEVKKFLKEVEGFLGEISANITNTDVWGKQPLAYRIKTHKDGIYVVYNIELAPEKVSELNEQLRIEKEVLRHIVIALPEGYTYSKFDEIEEEEDEGELPEAKAKPTKPAATKAKKIEAKEVAEPKHKGKEASGKELDSKLDAIIGGDDIDNL